ncbi:hypothetical protein D1P53_001030 [Cryptococcus gattii VGV]|nr:hypothetical protein D1P53_001030 [Cryptococcus gattii VGV]
MTSPERTGEDWASIRAAALAQLNSDSPLTSLSNPSGSSPYQAPRERPKSPQTNIGPILSLIPFDLNEPYEASEYLTIRPYNEACQVDYLGEHWVNAYKNEVIYDEQTFDDKYVRRYLDLFIKENPKMRATDFSHQANLKTVFYDRKGQRGKFLESCGSKKDGATTPDASLIGHVKDSGCTSGWKPVLYAVVELKWTKLATYLSGEDKRGFDEKTLRYRCQEGVFQTMWYVILGYAISGCTFGLSIANEYFYRIVYLDRNPTSENPVLALEADSVFLEKVGRHFGYQRDAYSVGELSGLPDFWSSPPNRLISDRANSILNKEARYRLDATILLFLAHAASLPTQRFLSDPSPLLGSAFDTSSNSNEETRVLDHLSAAPYPEINESDTVDIDLDDIDSESGELTLAAYRDRLAMLGVLVKLVTQEEMDVLLARR